MSRVKLVDDTYYILAIPESDTASALATSPWASSSLPSSQSSPPWHSMTCFVLADDEHDDHDHHEYVKIGRGLRFSPLRGQARNSLVHCGTVLLWQLTFYMQTLFAPFEPRATVQSGALEQIDQTLKNNALRKDELTRQYSEHYTTARIIAYIVEHNPEKLATRADLHNMAKTLNIEVNLSLRRRRQYDEPKLNVAAIPRPFDQSMATPLSCHTFSSVNNGSGSAPCLHDPEDTMPGLLLSRNTFSSFSCSRGAPLF